MATEMIDGYAVDGDGIIRSPGKFEGEYYYTPYFWAQVLDGAESETIYDGDTPIAVFVIDADDRAKFAALAIGSVYAIVVWESDQGFVYTREMTAQQVENFRETCEQSDEGGR